MSDTTTKSISKEKEALKILGISNPSFTGVTVATKAICTDYYPIGHQTDTLQIQRLAKAIVNFNPDVLVVGGWSRGYNFLVEFMRHHKKFPVIMVQHSHLFHGEYFGDNVYQPEIEACRKQKSIDLVAYVQPEMARYVQEYRGVQSAWIPHYFPIGDKAPRAQKFTIGVLGAMQSPLKNMYGCLQVAKDFKNNVGADKVEIVLPNGNEMPHLFLERIRRCSVLLHTSHLECYPNTVQEAWSVGVPVILSTASAGLYNSPLTPTVWSGVSDLVVKNNNDPLELYDRIMRVYADYCSGSTYSDSVYTEYKTLSALAEVYTAKVLDAVHHGYTTRSDGNNYAVLRSLTNMK